MSMDYRTSVSMDYRTSLSFPGTDDVTVHTTRTSLTSFPAPCVASATPSILSPSLPFPKPHRAVSFSKSNTTRYFYKDPPARSFSRETNGCRGSVSGCTLFQSLSLWIVGIVCCYFILYTAFAVSSADASVIRGSVMAEQVERRVLAPEEEEAGSAVKPLTGILSVADSVVSKANNSIRLGHSGRDGVLVPSPSSFLSSFSLNDKTEDTVELSEGSSASTAHSRSARRSPLQSIMKKRGPPSSTAAAATKPVEVVDQEKSFLRGGFKKTILEGNAAEDQPQKQHRLRGTNPSPSSPSSSSSSLLESASARIAALALTGTPSQGVLVSPVETSLEGIEAAADQVKGLVSEAVEDVEEVMGGVEKEVEEVVELGRSGVQSVAKQLRGTVEAVQEVVGPHEFVRTGDPKGTAEEMINVLGRGSESVKSLTELMKPKSEGKAAEKKTFVSPVTPLLSTMGTRKHLRVPMAEAVKETRADKIVTDVANHLREGVLRKDAEGIIASAVYVQNAAVTEGAKVLRKIAEEVTGEIAKPSLQAVGEAMETVFQSNDSSSFSLAEESKNRRSEEEASIQSHEGRAEEDSEWSLSLDGSQRLRAQRLDSRLGHPVAVLVDGLGEGEKVLKGRIGGQERGRGEGGLRLGQNQRLRNNRKARKEEAAEWTSARGGLFRENVSTDGIALTLFD